jgi:hypothetical protein
MPLGYFVQKALEKRINKEPNTQLGIRSSLFRGALDLAERLRRHDAIFN